MKHLYGKFESVKFEHRRADFKKYVEYLEANTPSCTDFLEHFPAWVGHMSLHRMITLYELYKKVLGLAGHIGEVGVFKGAGTLLFAKLVHIFESESLTQVHGFDWFKGTGRGGENDTSLVPQGGYQSSYEDLLKITDLQKLDHIVRIHNFDVTESLTDFFEQNQHLQFKLVFLDAGMYEVMKCCVPAFWSRLVPGGIMVFDQYSHEFAPGETIAVREFLPNVRINTIENSWMPNAYAVKE
jgi:hypothetical protein